eukprot:707630-Rhodomonas_salina.3
MHLLIRDTNPTNGSKFLRPGLSARRARNVSFVRASVRSKKTYYWSPFAKGEQFNGSREARMRIRYRCFKYKYSQHSYPGTPGTRVPRVPGYPGNRVTVTLSDTDFVRQLEAELFKLDKLVTGAAAMTLTVMPLMAVHR